MSTKQEQATAEYEKKLKLGIKKACAGDSHTRTVGIQILHELCVQLHEENQELKAADRNHDAARSGNEKRTAKWFEDCCVMRESIRKISDGTLRIGDQEMTAHAMEGEALNCIEKVSDYPKQDE